MYLTTRDLTLFVAQTALFLQPVVIQHDHIKFANDAHYTRYSVLHIPPLQPQPPTGAWSKTRTRHHNGDAELATIVTRPRLLGYHAAPPHVQVSLHSLCILTSHFRHCRSTSSPRCSPGRTHLFLCNLIIISWQSSGWPAVRRPAARSWPCCCFRYLICPGPELEG